MTDLISRQTAIKAIDDLPNCYNGYSDTYDKAYIIGVLEELPTIDPVKHGKWIEDAKTYYEQFDKRGMLDENTPYLVDDIACSVCLAKYSVIDNETERFEYCPNCGAKMDGGKGCD